MLSNYFVESFVGDKALAYYSSPEMKVAACANMNVAEIGFVGRVLLNAFNAWEFGNENGRDDLAASSKKIFDSYLENGFTETGYLREWVNLENDSDVKEERPVHSIRRQSEGIYAMFHYLNYEQKYKRHHPDWEQRLKKMLDMFLQLQNPDGSFPRKFHDDFTVVDGSGGSTPSATLPLVMGYKYFKDKRYLSAARRTAEYLEKELISKADYFSSTLDANCEDKEASLYAATATYYLALVTKGAERAHYDELCRKGADCALSCLHALNACRHDKYVDQYQYNGFIPVIGSPHTHRAITTSVAPLTRQYGQSPAPLFPYLPESQTHAYHDSCNRQ